MLRIRLIIRVTVRKVFTYLPGSAASYVMADEREGLSAQEILNKVPAEEVIQ